MTHAVAWAVATGNDVAADDVEKLQQELDAVVDRLIDQYPEPQPELVLNCMLLAGTERLASRDFVTANYHFAWFRALDGPRRSKD